MPEVRGTTQTPFHLIDDNAEDNDVVDDFFDTASPSSQRGDAHQRSSSRTYDLSSERFIFDGDDENVIVSPGSPTTLYGFRAAVNTEPLLPNYLMRGCDYRQQQHVIHQQYSQDEDDHWSADHQLALPFARLALQPFVSRQRHELSGLNYLNLCTLLVHLTTSLVIGSGLVERHNHHWLPSSWTVTTLPEYDSLLTPSRWAEDYLWIPVLAMEGVFVLVQLFPKVRSRPEVVMGVGYTWFYVGMLQSLGTLLFSLKCIIATWIVMACTVAFLLHMLYWHQQSVEYSTLVSPRRWEYWVFWFPFDLHLGWLLPLLASRGSMIFRYHCGKHRNVGLQLAVDIVAMALLLPCAGVYLVRGNTGPRNWVVPLAILWAYLGIAFRLTMNPPETLVEAYGMDILEAVRDAAWVFSSTVGFLVLPRILIWVAREFFTIHVVQLAGDDDEADEDIDDLMHLPSRGSAESGVHCMTEI